jgi:hypothetical protein
MKDKEFLADAYIQEGMSPAHGIIVACATVGDDDENPETRIGVRHETEWFKLGLSGFSGLSIDTHESGTGYVLGESGSVAQFYWNANTVSDLKKTRRLTENLRAQDEGPLRRLRVLGDDVVSAGSVGQVYVLKNDRFIELPKLVVNGDPPTIEDLAGSSTSDFIAVTSDGFVAHFNGKLWSVIDFPSNASFTSICMFSKGHYAVCGKGGAIVFGTMGAWTIVQGLDEDVDYCGIASHEKRLYAAHLEGIDEIGPAGAKPVSIRKAASLEFTVLRSCADGVWSFADHTIGSIVNGVWKTVVS